MMAISTTLLMGTLGRKKSRKGASIDKSVLRFGVAQRIRDRHHLDWIRTLPCCRTGAPPPSDPAHISADNLTAIMHQALPLAIPR